MKKVFTPETMKVLRAYDWPGNVRELENAVQRAVTLAQGDKIFPDALPQQLFKPGLGVTISFENFLEEKLSDLVDRLGGLERGDIYDLVMQRVEKPLITLVLRKTEGNQVRAANLLGINRNTLRKKIKELGIRGPFGEDEVAEENG
jgi:two-component system nitrogen regulation response regulator GlnG